jgi:hypothetical protein
MKSLLSSKGVHKWRTKNLAAYVKFAFWLLNLFTVMTNYKNVWKSQFMTFSIETLQKTILGGIVIFVGIVMLFGGEGSVRKDKLNEWLHAQSLENQPDKQRLEKWLSDIDTRVMEVNQVSVNPAQLGDVLTFVVYSDSIPGVIPHASFNAAYDKALNVIFLDSGLLRLVDSEDAIHGDQLLLFLILHELGHRHHKHKGLRRAVPENDEIIWTGSKQQEIEADNYALAQYFSIVGAEKANQEKWVQANFEFQLFLEDAVLGDFLGLTTAGLQTQHLTHPNILERADHLVQALIDSNKGYPSIQASHQATLNWLVSAQRDAKAYLVAEIALPEHTVAARISSNNNGLVALLGSGRVAAFDRDTFVEAKESETKIASSRLLTKDAHIETEWPLLELTSGSVFWHRNNEIFLIRPWGNLYVLSEQTNWAWLQLPKIRYLEDTAVNNDHIPSRMECDILPVNDGNSDEDNWSIVRLDRTDSGIETKIVGQVSVLRPDTQPSHAETSSGSTVVIWRRKNKEDQLGNTARVWSFSAVCAVSSKLVAPIEVELTLEEDQVIFYVAPLEHSEGFIMVSTATQWRTVTITHVSIDGAITRAFTLPTYLDGINEVMEPQLSPNLPSFSVTPGFMSKDESHLAFDAGGIGSFVIDLEKQEFIINGGIGRGNGFTLFLLDDDYLVTFVARARRLLLWKLPED